MTVLHDLMKWSNQQEIRKCGICDLCCIIPAIETINKSENVPCFYLCNQEEKCKDCHRPKTDCQIGCSCYEYRPEECVSFQCLWSLGLTPIEEQPSRIGILVFARGSTMYFIEKDDGAKTFNKDCKLVKLYGDRMKEFVKAGYTVVIKKGKLGIAF